MNTAPSRCGATFIFVDNRLTCDLPPDHDGDHQAGQPGDFGFWRWEAEANREPGWPVMSQSELRSWYVVTVLFSLTMIWVMVQLIEEAGSR